MNRTQLVLVGLLLVQAVLILVFQSPWSGATATTQTRPLLPLLEAITPDRIEIGGADDATIELVREADGWQIAGLGGFPADATKVDNLLDELKGLRVRRPVVSTKRYHDTFQVADEAHEARIRLWDDSGDPDVDLIVGSSPNFRSSHVRLAGEEAVYEVRGLSPYDVRPTTNSWIVKDLVDADATRVIGLVLTNAEGTIELSKQDGIWKLDGTAAEGRELDQGKIDSLIRSLSSIRLDDGVGATDAETQGLDAPEATIVLRWEGDEAGPDGAPVVHQTKVLVGSQVADDDAKRYVTRDGFGFTGTVWESGVRRALDESVEALLAS